MRKKRRPNPPLIEPVRALRMVRSLDDLPPERPLPSRYRSRTFRRGEESTWGALLEKVSEFGSWDQDRIDQAFARSQRPGFGRVDPNSIHFIVCSGEPVATACTQIHGEHPDFPELSWVGVDPRHRRLGLGRAVSRIQLAFMKSLGYTRCFLKTNTSLLPAIALFLTIGFTPFRDDSKYDPHLWQRIKDMVGKV